ncbi:4984_t:CDS:2 [Scutellospora calospora]|uniref:4984_t:CDS:1 n=1 Tax=Scutellospora calospora TaxID=85575 RepID=A0ACA9KBH7_9GLOM|nr:4984_t:CDS:2 [Scutellospora calospora]
MKEDNLYKSNGNEKMKTEKIYRTEKLPVQKNSVQKVSSAPNSEIENCIVGTKEGSVINSDIVIDEDESGDSDVSAETDLEIMRIENETNNDRRKGQVQEAENEKKQVELTITNMLEPTLTEEINSEEEAQDKGQNNNNNLNDKAKVLSSPSSQIRVQKNIENIANSKSEDYMRLNMLKEEGFMMVTYKKRDLKASSVKSMHNNRPNLYKKG